MDAAHGQPFCPPEEPFCFSSTRLTVLLTEVEATDPNLVISTLVDELIIPWQDTTGIEATGAFEAGSFYRLQIVSYSAQPSVSATRLGGSVDFSLQLIPEPASAALLATGLLLLTVKRR